MNQTYGSFIESLKSGGKIVLLFTDTKEFIFGDGFYHNLVSNTDNAVFTRILAPLTPRLAVLYTCPMAYNPDPPLVTRRAKDDLVQLINSTVQIYSKECLFYRSEVPELSRHFTSHEHLEYNSGDPVDDLIKNIPGVNYGGLSLPF